MDPRTPAGRAPIQLGRLATKPLTKSLHILHYALRFIMLNRIFTGGIFSLHSYFRFISLLYGSLQYATEF